MNEKLIPTDEKVIIELDKEGQMQVVHESDEEEEKEGQPDFSYKNENKEECLKKKIRAKCTSFSGIRYWNVDKGREEVMAKNIYNEPMVVRCNKEGKTSLMVLGFDQYTIFIDT